MTANDSDDKLGHDPLEWLAEDAETGADAGEDSLQQVTQQTGAKETAKTSPEANEAQVNEDSAPREEVGSTPSIIQVGADLTVQHTESLQKDWMAILEDYDPANGELTIDLSQTEQLDSSGYQLLVSLVKHCKTEGVSFTLANASSNFVEQLSTIGDVTLGQEIDSSKETASS